MIDLDRKKVWTAFLATKLSIRKLVIRAGLNYRTIVRALQAGKASGHKLQALSDALNVLPEDLLKFKVK